MGNTIQKNKQDKWSLKRIVFLHEQQINTFIKNTYMMWLSLFKSASRFSEAWTSGDDEAVFKFSLTGSSITEN